MEVNIRIIHGASRSGTTLFLRVDESSNGCSFPLSCYIVFWGYRSNGKLLLMLQKSYHHELSSGKYPELYTMGFTMSQNSVQDFYHETYHRKRTIHYFIHVKGSDFLSHVCWWSLTSYVIITDPGQLNISNMTCLGILYAWMMQTICQHGHIGVQKVTRSWVYILPPKQAFLHRNHQGFAFVIHSTSLHCIKQSIA